MNLKLNDNIDEGVEQLVRMNNALVTIVTDGNFFNEKQPLVYATNIETL